MVLCFYSWRSFKILHVMILYIECGDVGSDSIITINISPFLIENIGALRYVPGPVTRQSHSPKLDMSYLFRTLTMSSVRKSHALHPYCLSFDYAVCMICPISYNRVIDMFIELIVDWTICHCSVIVSCDWSFDDHSCKTYWINSIITNRYPMQIADLETFV